MTGETYTITDNLAQLLAVLPPALQDAIAPEDRARLIEIVLDLGRRPEVRFSDNSAVYIAEGPIDREDLDYVEARLGAFGNDNRAGIPATLHRISAMRNRRGTIVGLTLRVGRAVTGIVDILRDIIESGQSLLLMGRPGLGKTTLLRELARVLADELGKRVVIVDTSNEIAGDGDVPHPAIGRARRMQVARVEQQHDVMIEAVENHMPEVVVIDEIGRIEETLAARTIAERGVQLVATVHGNTLDNLLANPTMSDLVGGVQAVTLSDEEARRRHTQKTVLERKAPPTFDVVVEMIERDKIAVRRPVAEVVDGLLRGLEVPPELRWRDENGEVQVSVPDPAEVAARAQHDFENRTHDAPRRGEGRRNGPGDGPGRANTREARGRTAPARRYGDDLTAYQAERRGGRLVVSTPTAGTSSPVVAKSGARETATSNGAVLADDEWEPELPEEGSEADDEIASGILTAPIDVSRLRRLYPFGVSRSRLARAIKHLGLPLHVARTWKDADAVLLLSGEGGLSPNGTLLREARELGLPLVGVEGNTYGQILTRLNELFNAQPSEGRSSPREMAIHEAKTAVQRVLAEAGPVELRPQKKPLRRLQHQLAERYHLRSYSVGREPNRRVRFLPGSGR